MSSRKEHLDLAIARAKQRLTDTGATTSFPEEETRNDKKTQPPKSRLNQLLGKREVPIPQQGALLQRVGVVQRPAGELCGPGAFAAGASHSLCREDASSNKLRRYCSIGFRCFVRVDR